MYLSTDYLCYIHKFYSVTIFEKHTLQAVTKDLEPINLSWNSKDVYKCCYGNRVVGKMYELSAKKVMWFDHKCKIGHKSINNMQNFKTFVKCVE